MRFPTAILKIKKGNVLVIEFDKMMVTRVDSIELAANMIVVLEGTKEECKLTWSLEKNFTAYEEFNKLTINAFPQCTLQQSSQSFLVTFLDLSLLVATNGNQMKSNNLRVNSMRFIYLSGGEEAVMSGAGSAFGSSSLATFGVVIVTSIFQSVAVGAFWSFLNMLQLISYLPALKCKIPYNLEIFLTEYLTVKGLVFPFELLPDFGFNPLELVGEFLTKPFNDKFFTAGYETISFIFNFSDEILTWFLLFLLYLALKFFCWLIPKEK